jgi:hypothetical protein
MTAGHGRAAGSRTGAAVRRTATTAALAAAVLLPAAGGADPVERTTTLADVRGVNLTIYNGALALVHDRRRLELQPGINRVAWRDVGASMDATSAVLADLTVPGAVRVVEQNFNFDLLKPSTILDKFVGRDVTVVHDKPAPGQPPRETAKLLADNDGLVLQFADRVETGLSGSHLVFGSLPGDLRDRPTLVLDLQSDRAGSADLDLSYLTDGLGWRADYVGVVSPKEDRMDLQGLITLSNTSGTSFPNARLQLVAGNVNYVAPPTGSENGAPMAATDNAQAVTQQNFFEYHLYTLAQPTSVLDNQTKQVSLLNARGVPVRKTLELRGSDAYYSNPDADLGAKLKVGVYVTFTNRGGNLGVPLPGGIVRLYKNDAGGTSQFLGSDSIDHTPRNQDVRLHVGDSFDVTANKKQLTFRSLGDCSFASSYRIVLANAKTESATVLVVEPIPGDWQITSENRRHVKSSSTTATWTVAVPAGGNATLDYSAHVKLCI